MRIGLSLIGALFCVPFVVWLGMRVYAVVEFDLNCGSYLSQAAAASTVKQADELLSRAIEYAESHRMTAGSTGILFHRPTNDIGVWYRNLTGARDQLRAAEGADSSLASTNLLMKVHESLLVHGEKGSSVRAPDGISIAPNNVPYCVFGWVSVLLGAVGVLMFIAGASD